MTLRDIAKEVGTTAATVSRVLNGCNRNFSVTPELRAKILAVAERGDYRPNPLFRGMRTRKNLPLTVIFPSSTLEATHTVSNTAVQTLSQELHARGRECFFSFSYSTDRKVFRMPPWKTGAVILPDVRMREEMSVVRDSGVPVLVVNGIGDETCDVIACDSRHNMGLLFNHLHGRGHRRIFYASFTSGMYPSPASASKFLEHYSVEEREKAYLEQCELHGVAPLEGWGTRTQEESVHLDLALKHRATAVICYNHGTAMRLLHEAWLRGMNVPKDLSIVCFNNDPLIAYANPAITCLDPDGAALGRAAADQLGRRLEDAEGMLPPQHILIGGRLIVRDSVAAPVR